jgi:hypothetical protein
MLDRRIGAAILTLALVLPGFSFSCGEKKPATNPVAACRQLARGSDAERRCVQRAFNGLQARAIRFLPTTKQPVDHTAFIRLVNRLTAIELYASDTHIPLHADPRLAPAKTVEAH